MAIPCTRQKRAAMVYERYLILPFVKRQLMLFMRSAVKHVLERRELFSFINPLFFTVALITGVEIPDSLAKSAIWRNASITKLKQTLSVSNVPEILENNRFDPHSLQIEITESVFLNESQTVSMATAYLHELGRRIALIALTCKAIF